MQFTNLQTRQFGKLRGGKDDESEREGDGEVMGGGIVGDGGEDRRSRRWVEVVTVRRDGRNGRREGEIRWLMKEGGNWHHDRELETGKGS